MTWNLDPAHSGLQFAVKHMVIATVRGGFRDFTVEAEIDEKDLTNSRATVRIDAASLTTGNDDRDAHLRSADFFDVENHPAIVFVSRGIERRRGDDYRINGDLTIRGVTKPVTIPGTLVFWDDQTKTGRMKGQFTIVRSEYGVAFNSRMNPIADEVAVSFNITFKPQPQAK